MGIRITDEFLKFSDHLDPVEDRPWSILYSENYYNEVFTREMADRLTNIWDGISGYNWKFKPHFLYFYFTPHIDYYNSLQMTFNNELDVLKLILVDKHFIISDKLVGITMTKEVIELLDYVTDKTNCG